MLVIASQYKFHLSRILFKLIKNLHKYWCVCVWVCEYMPYIFENHKWLTNIMQSQTHARTRHTHTHTSNCLVTLMLGELCKQIKVSFYFSIFFLVAFCFCTFKFFKLSIWLGGKIAYANVCVCECGWAFVLQCVCVCVSLFVKARVNKFEFY